MTKKKAKRIVLGVGHPSVYASRVKIADMLHNLSETPTKNQVKRYAKGLMFLLDMESKKEAAR